MQRFHTSPHFSEHPQDIDRLFPSSCSRFRLRWASSAPKRRVDCASRVLRRGAREAAEQLRTDTENELGGRDGRCRRSERQVSEAQTKLTSTEAELIKAQKEKNDLQARVRRKRNPDRPTASAIEKAREGRLPGQSATASTADLQAQLEDAKKQLDAAEREKALLSARAGPSRERSDQLGNRNKKAASGRRESWNSRHGPRRQPTPIISSS